MKGSEGTGTNSLLNPPGMGFGSPGFPRAKAAVASMAETSATTPTATSVRRPSPPHRTLFRRATPLGANDSTPPRSRVQASGILCEHTFVTSRDHPYSELRRALKNGNVWVAEAVARELQHVWLEDALKLTRLLCGEGAVGQVRAGDAEVAPALPG
jgi:hypothetical protein